MYCRQTLQTAFSRVDWRGTVTCCALFVEVMTDVRVGGEVASCHWGNVANAQWEKFGSDFAVLRVHFVRGSFGPATPTPIWNFRPICGIGIPRNIFSREREKFSREN